MCVKIRYYLAKLYFIMLGVKFIPTMEKPLSEPCKVFEFNCSGNDRGAVYFYKEVAYYARLWFSKHLKQRTKFVYFVTGIFPERLKSLNDIPSFTVELSPFDRWLLGDNIIIDVLHHAYLDYIYAQLPKDNTVMRSV